MRIETSMLLSGFKPDRVRVGLFRVVFVLTRVVDGDRLSGQTCEARIKVLLV